MLTASLDVQGDQVEAELLARLLEEVVLHLGGHRVVERLGNLFHKRRISEKAWKASPNAQKIYLKDDVTQQVKLLF